MGETGAVDDKGDSGGSTMSTWILTKLSRSWSIFDAIGSPTRSGNTLGSPKYIRTRKRFRTVTWRYKKTIGQVGSFVFLVNQILGAGLVSIPSVMASSGWLPCLVTNVFVCAVSAFCTLMLMRGMTMIPGNQNFDQRFEFGAVLKYYFPKKLAFLIEAVYHIGVQCGNVVCVIAVAQVVDHIFVLFMGSTVGLQVWPSSSMSTGAIGVEQKLEGLVGIHEFWGRPFFRKFDATQLSRLYNGSPMGIIGRDVTESNTLEGGSVIFGITLGYLITALVCIRLSAMDLEENMNVQFVSFCVVLVVVLQLSSSAAFRIGLSKVPPQRGLYDPQHGSAFYGNGNSDSTVEFSRRLQKRVADPVCSSATYLDGLATTASGIVPSYVGSLRESSSVQHLRDQLSQHDDFPASKTVVPKLDRRSIQFPGIFGMRQFGPMVTTFLDGYQYVISTPPWANEMTDDVKVGQIVWKSAVFAGIVYYIWGFVMAAAFPLACETGSNIFHQLLLHFGTESHDLQHPGLKRRESVVTLSDDELFLEADEDKAAHSYSEDRDEPSEPLPSTMSLLNVVAIYAFLLITVLPGVVTANMSAKYNLINTGICAPIRAFLLACVVPFCASWVLSADIFADILGWISLWTGLVCNFIAPSAIYIIACKNSSFAKRNPVRRRHETLAAQKLLEGIPSLESTPTNTGADQASRTGGGLVKHRSRLLAPIELNKHVEGINAGGAGGPQYTAKVREVQRALQDWLTEFAKQEDADEDVAMLANWCPENPGSRRPSQDRFDEGTPMYARRPGRKKTAVRKYASGSIRFEPENDVCKTASFEAEEEIRKTASADSIFLTPPVDGATDPQMASANTQEDTEPATFGRPRRGLRVGTISHKAFAKRSRSMGNLDATDTGQTRPQNEVLGDNSPTNSAEVKAEPEDAAYGSRRGTSERHIPGDTVTVLACVEAAGPEDEADRPGGSTMKEEATVTYRRTARRRGTLRRVKRPPLVAGTPVDAADVSADEGRRDAMDEKDLRVVSGSNDNGDGTAEADAKMRFVPDELRFQGRRRKGTLGPGVRLQGPTAAGGVPAVNTGRRTEFSDSPTSVGENEHRDAADEEGNALRELNGNLLKLTVGGDSPTDADYHFESSTSNISLFDSAASPGRSTDADLTPMHLRSELNGETMFKRVAGEAVFNGTFPVHKKSEEEVAWTAAEVDDPSASRDPLYGTCASITVCEVDTKPPVPQIPLEAQSQNHALVGDILSPSHILSPEQTPRRLKPCLSQRTSISRDYTDQPPVKRASVGFNVDDEESMEVSHHSIKGKQSSCGATILRERSVGFAVADVDLNEQLDGAASTSLPDEASCQMEETEGMPYDGPRNKSSHTVTRVRSPTKRGFFSSVFRLLQPGWVTLLLSALHPERSHDLFGAARDMEDSYDVDEDPSTGQLKNIRVHVFPAGILRRHHLAATYCMLSLLIGMSAITFTLDVYSRLC